MLSTNRRIVLALVFCLMVLSRSESPIAAQAAKLKYEFERLPQTKRGLFSTPVFSPDGQLLAAPSTAGTVVVWDLSSGKVKLRIEYGKNDLIHRPAFSPDGACLYAIVNEFGADGDLYAQDGIVAMVHWFDALLAQEIDLISAQVAWIESLGAYQNYLPTDTAHANLVNAITNLLMDAGQSLRELFG